MVQRAYFYGLGKRKTSRAAVKLFPAGQGNTLVNGKSLREWVDGEGMTRTVLAPLSLLGMKKDFDLEIRTSGGGRKAQAEAARLGISRALIKKEVRFKEQLRDAGFLTRDPRVKERKKPGLKRARRAPQFAKR